MFSCGKKYIGPVGASEKALLLIVSSFIDAFNCYKQKCKLAPFNSAHPVTTSITELN